MHGYGGMIAAVVAGGRERTVRFLERCRLFALAESLGGVESLIEHPAIMTHSGLPAEKLRRRGDRDGLVRISVGVEDVERSDRRPPTGAAHNAVLPPTAALLADDFLQAACRPGDE